MQQFNSLQSKNPRLSLKEDALSNVLGKDRPGKVKGLGFGVTMSKLKAQAHTNKAMLALKENLRALAAKVDLLSQSNQQADNAHSHEFDNSMVIMQIIFCCTLNCCHFVNYLKKITNFLKKL